MGFYQITYNFFKHLSESVYDLESLGKLKIFLTNFFRLVFTDFVLHSNQNPATFLESLEHIHFLNYSIIGNLNDNLEVCLQILRGFSPKITKKNYDQKLI